MVSNYYHWPTHQLKSYLILILNQIQYLREIYYVILIIFVTRSFCAQWYILIVTDQGAGAILNQQVCATRVFPEENAHFNMKRSTLLTKRDKQSKCKLFLSCLVTVTVFNHSNSFESWPEWRSLMMIKRRHSWTDTCIICVFGSVSWELLRLVEVNVYASMNGVPNEHSSKVVGVERLLILTRSLKGQVRG